MIFDLLYILGELMDWGKTTPVESSGVNTIRKMSTIFSIFNLFLKIVLCFSGWRLSIIYKMKEVNILNIAVKPMDDMNFRAAVKVEPKKKKKGRPSIAHKRGVVENTSLRFLDGGL
jgi:hypothetical protein